MKKVIKEKYVAAVLGVGRIGMRLEKDSKRLKPATHFGMWEKNTDTDLVAVCDADDKNLEFAKKLNPKVKVYKNAENLLKSVKPDIVSISTWRDTHFEMMKLCSKYEIPAVVCEKPIAENFDDADEIIKELRRKGIHLFVNHRRRFDKVLYNFKDKINNGIIGEIQQVTTNYVYGLITTGTHTIDHLRFFLKDQCGDVKWVIGLQNETEAFSPPDDPCTDFILGFENGTKVFGYSLNIKDYDIYNTNFYGSKGKAVFKNIGRDIEIYNVKPSPEHENFTELEDAPSIKLGGLQRDLFGCLAENVIQTLKGKETSLSTGEDSTRALEILLAVRESSEKDNIKIFI